MMGRRWTTALGSMAALMWTLTLGAGCDDGSDDVDDAGPDASDGDFEADGDAEDGDVEDADPPQPTAADTLARYLIGDFDSSDQAATNPQYWPVQLATCRVDVPELGDIVLYVEQAMMDDPTRPYRQRLYVVRPGDHPDTEAVSQVWEPGASNTLVGLCDDPDGRTIDGADATERPGCAIYMTWVDDHFEGSTNGEECESSLSGATYATSSVSLYADSMESWDRGFDSAGVQVWGAVDGPYIFERKSALEEE